jgi:hypothetical protein
MSKYYFFRKLQVFSYYASSLLRPCSILAGKVMILFISFILRTGGTPVLPLFFTSKENIHHWVDWESRPTLFITEKDPCYTKRRRVFIGFAFMLVAVVNNIKIFIPAKSRINKILGFPPVRECPRDRWGKNN